MTSAGRAPAAAAGLGRGCLLRAGSAPEAATPPRWRLLCRRPGRFRPRSSRSPPFAAAGDFRRGLRLGGRDSLRRRPLQLLRHPEAVRRGLQAGAAAGDRRGQEDLHAERLGRHSGATRGRNSGSARGHARRCHRRTATVPAAAGAPATTAVPAATADDATAPPDVAPPPSTAMPPETPPAAATAPTAPPLPEIAPRTLCLRPEDGMTGRMSAIAARWRRTLGAERLAGRARRRGGAGRTGAGHRRAASRAAPGCRCRPTHGPGASPSARCAWKTRVATRARRTPRMPAICS